MSQEKEFDEGLENADVKKKRKIFSKRIKEAEEEIAATEIDIAILQRRLDSLSESDTDAKDRTLQDIAPMLSKIEKLGKEVKIYKEELNKIK